MAAATTSILLTADDRTRAAFDSARRNLSSLQSGAAKLNGILSTLGVGALAGGGLVAFAKQSIDAADNLNDLSKKTGVAVESLAGFDLVAKTSGTSLEDIASAVGRLNKSMGEAAAGNKEMAATLKALGVTAKTPEEALYQIADAFGRFESEGDKARALSQVLGKSWQSLAPALAEGGEGLRSIVEEGQRLNPVTKQMAEQADKFNDAMSRFKAEAAGVSTSIANALLPAMNDVLERWNTAIALSRQHGGFIGLVLGGINPTADAGVNLTQVRDEIAAIQLQLKDAGSVQGNIAGIDGPRLKARLAELEALKKTLLEIQSAQALALNDKFRTGNYKQPSGPAPKKISLPPTGEKNKTVKAKDRMSDAEWAMEESAHLTRTLYQIGEQMDAAREAAFDRATESAEAWNESLDAANARLRESAAGYIDLIDPVEKYRRQLEEIEQLAAAGLLSKEQATEATFAIQQQIDAAAGLGEEIKKTKSIAEELGLTFSSAFEDAVVSGKGLRDILQGVYQDILRLTVRKSVTEPLAAGFSGLLSGIDFKGLLPSFDTGTPYVPRDTLAMVHRGEAIIPAKDNRPGLGGVTVHMTVVTQDASSFRKSMGQVQADLAFAVNGARRFA